MWLEPERIQTLGKLPEFVELNLFDHDPQDQSLEYCWLEEQWASLVFFPVGVYMILARIDHCTSLKQGAPWLATQIYKEKGMAVVWRECRPPTTYTNPLKASTSFWRKITWHFPLLSYCTMTRTLYFFLFDWKSGPRTWPLKNDTY